MLNALTVQNLVVVLEIDVEFAPGLSVLTGETGAGKSILIEALALALGERADSQMVRTGADRASVTARFDIADNDVVNAFLRAHDLTAEDECLLRRVVSRDGRSRAYCNGTPIAVHTLRELGALLVDVHSQHASHRLLERDRQRELLDAYGNLDQELADVAAAHGDWKTAAEALATLEHDGEDRARFELLRYQVDELAGAKLDADELGTIENEHKRLANSATMLEHCAAVSHALDDDEAGAMRAVEIALQSVRALERLTPVAANLRVLLEQAGVAIDEAHGELQRLERDCAADPARLEAIDRRLGELHTLARKHQVSLTDLARRADELAAELGELESRSGDIDQLRLRRDEARRHYDDASARLTTARQQAAKAMNAEITARLRDLGIPHAQFAVQLSTSTATNPQAHGRDRIEFSVTTNPELAPGPLNKVASGGELSRIGLAIQAATAGRSGVPVVVYDEVDTGIGGTTANVVGRNLREVAAHCQVICITHSPQVASAGEHHYLVSKEVVDGQAETRLEALSRKARESEIARMLGAEQATTPSLQHARDLLAQAARG
ncbi:MAG: DNA repair protein RecN [Gammaproteobacteria bacterium]